MKTLQTLIAAIDFTPSCRNALREAARIASIGGGKVVAIHVMEEALMNELKKTLSASQASVRAEWENRLRQFVEGSDLAGMAFVETEVRIGHPFMELAEACRVHRADLLVMGVKGEKDAPHRVGVIAAKCVRKAPADVLLVSDGTHGPFKHLVTCVDFSDNSAKAVRFALQLAKQDGASLDCVNVYQSALALSLDYGGLAAPMPIGADAETMERCQRELEAFVKPLIGSDYASVPVTLRVMERVNIREAIVDHVNERQADLVVLGTRGKTGLRELLIGTTAEKVVANAPCSILAVKPDEVD
ncbi:MAG: universal stress protein [Prosthecobacter sp.]|nr:universal stress protein [Prosthecobacter sp.]